jgi:hypothetical protein
MANAAQIKARIEEVAKELAKGTQRMSIIRKFEKKWGCSDKSIDRYMKEALPIAEKLAEIKRKTTESTIIAETEQAVKNGLKTDFEFEMQLQKIAFGELEILETIDTPNGVSTKTRKPTPAEMTKATELILKKRGSLAAEKKEISVNQPMIINWNGNTNE